MTAGERLERCGSITGRGLIVALVCAGIALAPGCVSKSKFNKMQDDLDACDANVKQLETRVVEQETSAVVTDTLYGALVNEMQGEIEAKQIAIEQMKSGVNLHLPEAVLFSSGSADVSESGKRVLHKVAGQLKNVPYQTIVAGFTDNVPIGGKLAERYPSNWELAAARASHVVCLLQKAGVPGARLVVVSFGAHDPVASNDSPEGRMANRRIEIRLRPVEVYE